MDNTLVVSGYLRAGLVQIIVADILACIAARLVAERPHRDARVAPVSVIHSLDPVEVSRSPLEIVAYLVYIIVRSEKCAVSFDIRLVDYIKTVCVGKSYQTRVGGIVRGAYRVAVILLDEFYIFFIVVKGHDIAGLAVCVVMIDALELDNLSVECKGVALYLHCFEARDVSERHELFAVLIQCYISAVDGWDLRVPLGDIEIVECHVCKAFCLYSLSGDNLAVLFEREGDFAAVEFAFECDFDIHRPFSVCLARADIVIVYVDCRKPVEKHVAEYSVLAEHVLTFEISAGAPFVNDCEQLVRALVYKFRDVELRRIVRALAVADIHSVDIKVNARNDAEEAQNMNIVGICDFKSFAVDSGGHMLGYIRVGQVELVGAVEIDRRLVAGALPCRGDMYPVELNACRVEHFGDERDIVVIFEIPLAGENLDKVGISALVLEIDGAQLLLF